MFPTGVIMAEKIEGRVAKILNETHLIINCGSADGVQEGMAFVVLAEGEEVHDPETGQSLGRWEIPKGRVRAAHVQEKLATCVAHAEETRNEQSADPSTRTLSADMIRVSMRDGRSGDSAKLRVNPADVSGVPDVGPISVGDKVRSVSA